MTRKKIEEFRETFDPNDILPPEKREKYESKYFNHAIVLGRNYWEEEESESTKKAKKGMEEMFIKLHPEIKNELDAIALFHEEMRGRKIKKVKIEKVPIDPSEAWGRP